MNKLRELIESTTVSLRSDEQGVIWCNPLASKYLKTGKANPLVVEREEAFLDELQKKPLLVPIYVKLSTDKEAHAAFKMTGRPQIELAEDFNTVINEYRTYSLGLH